MEYVIYKATHQRNHKVYIGITKQDLERRINAHRNSINSAIHYETRSGMMIFDIIDTAQDHYEALGKESYYIEQFNSMHPYGYNRIRSHRYIKGGGDCRTQKEISEERRKIRRGIIRSVPSLQMPSGGFHARYNGQPMIERISEYQCVRHQQYVIRTESQSGGIRKSYTQSLIFVAPISSFSLTDDHKSILNQRYGYDFDLVRTGYYRAHYEEHGEWYWSRFNPSYRQMTEHVWDWIYDDIDKQNQYYIESRNWKSCDVWLPWNILTNVRLQLSDMYCYPMTIEDYLSGRG